mgnify:FL=1
MELIIAFAIGFFIGYKLLYALMNYREFVADTQSILLSSQGSLAGGFIGGAISAYLKYSDKKKHELDRKSVV